MVFDPATVEELRDSPRLPAMGAIFKAIAANKAANEVWALTSKTCQQLNAVERHLIPDLVRAELKKRGH